MRKPAAYLFAILAGAIIWFFFQNFNIEGVKSVRVVPKAEGSGSSTSSNTLEVDLERPASIARKLGLISAPAEPASLKMDTSTALQTIRVGAFHLDYLGLAKADKTYVLDIVARVVREFDIVALQGISPRSLTIVAELTDLVNQTGRKYDYVLGPPTTIEQQETQFAFLYDRLTILTDRSELYTLGDPNQLLQRDPLVGWFRTRKPAADQAFTFTLVNVHTDQRRNEQELNVLDDAFHEIRDDGRGEDDVILLGCFHADDRHLGELGQVPGIIPAIRGLPTDVDGTVQTENIVFQSPATDEFTGRAGVFDFLRAYNLTTERAREVSNFMPVWAEFLILEGGPRNRVAGQPSDQH